ncbi:hypothetical protein FQN49_002292 [Arthroderma sp. PD_2]|nr:hypothetical protein FQN49_002292 [Arthroderma sp. PD_2]
MLVYRDMVSKFQDELISEQFTIKDVGVAFEVEAPYEKYQESRDSVGEDEEVEVQHPVNTVAAAFGLQKTSFDKKGYRSNLRAYINRVMAELQARGTSQEEIDAIKEGILAYIGDVFANFIDIEFYTGESQDDEGMVVLLRHREDNSGPPYMIYWKHGLEAMTK